MIDFIRKLFTAKPKSIVKVSAGGNTYVEPGDLFATEEFQQEVERLRRVQDENK